MANSDKTEGMNRQSPNPWARIDDDPTWEHLTAASSPGVRLAAQAALSGRVSGAGPDVLAVQRSERGSAPTTADCLLAAEGSQALGISA